jgi:hypothetical protein
VGVRHGLRADPQDAAEVEPLATTYAQDPRFKVAYDSLIETPDEPTAVGPLLGPQRAIRVLTSRALATVLGGGDPRPPSRGGRTGEHPPRPVQLDPLTRHDWGSASCRPLVTSSCICRAT